MENIQDKWYTLRVISGKERKVIEQIEKVKEEWHINEIFWPKETVVQIVRGKKQNREKSKLPGYLFINLPMTTYAFDNVKNIDGVISFVTLDRGGKPTPVSKHEINRIKGEIDTHNQSIELTYSEGEKVEIIDGPFKTFNGTVSDIDGETINVMVTVFGRETPVKLKATQIKTFVE